MSPVPVIATCLTFSALTFVVGLAIYHVITKNGRTNLVHRHQNGVWTISDREIPSWKIARPKHVPVLRIACISTLFASTIVLIALYT